MNRLGKPYCDLARVSVEDAAKSRIDGALERYCRLGASITIKPLAYRFGRTQPAPQPEQRVSDLHAVCEMSISNGP